MTFISTEGPPQLSPFLLDLYAARKSQRFIHHVLSSLPKMVLSDSAFYLDLARAPRPRLTAITWPSTSSIKRLIPIFARYVAHHPAFALWQHRPDQLRVLSWAQCATHDGPGSSTLHRHFYGPLGITDQLAVPLSVTSDRLSCICLHRRESTFSETEQAYLRLLHPHLTQAFHQSGLLRRLHSDRARLRKLVNALHHAVIAVLPDGHIAWATRPGWTLL